MGETSDISVKYQKLAAEYSKLRAQVSVLKKAVSEEQNRSTELKEAIKEKDQTVRKLEQEIECLNFRNVQLMKRVSVLQNEVGGISEKSKNKHKAPVPSLVDEDVLNLELRNKIEENEKLYIQVTSAEIEHKRIVDDLMSQLEESKAEKLKETKELNESIAKYKTKIDRLTKERAKLEVELKNYEKEVKEIRIQEETCQEDLKTVETDLRKKKENAEEIIKQKLPFIDTRIIAVNSTNIPVVSHKHCCKLSKVLEQIASQVTDAIHFMCELHKNMEARIKLVDRDLLNNGVLNRLENHLKEGSMYLKKIDSDYQKFTKTVLAKQLFLIQGTDLNEVSISFSNYVNYIEKLLPYFLLSLNSESKTKGSILKLEEIHEKLYDLTVKLISYFNSLKNSLQLYVEMGSLEHNNSSFLIKRIFHILCNLLSLFEEMKKIFSAKIMTEQHLPIVTTEIKSLDSLILTSMISVINTIKKISQKIFENLEILCDGIPCKVRGFSNTVNSNSGKLEYKPVVLDLRKRGLKYMTSLQELQDNKNTIPYETALKNREILTTYADNKEDLMKKLSTTNERLKKTEQEKEHWMLEYQLLQMKQGKVDGIDNTIENKDIHQLFKVKKDQLLSQLQIADSKALAFYTENLFLHQKLNLAKISYQKLEQDLADSQYNLSQIQDELKTRVTMYENQLSTMSDHLAELNEKITEQSEELEVMKYTGGKKIKK